MVSIQMRFVIKSGFMMAREQYMEYLAIYNYALATAAWTR